MQSRTFKLKRLALALGVIGFFYLNPAQANIQNTLDNVFNTMSNTSHPAVYKGIRRGVISFGEVQTRSKIVNSTLVTFTPPSWNFGCGGINFYMGAFSFINKDQLIAVLRAIPSNAAGYAFKLALSSMSELIHNVIGDLWDQIYDFIQNFSDSCKISKYLVDTGLDLFTKDAEKVATAEGKAQDNFTSTLVDSVGLTADSEVMKAKRGNLVMRALKEQRIAYWIEGAASDYQESLEQIMSMTGSVIVTLGDDGGDDGRTPVTTSYIGSKIDLADLVEGGENLPYWKCNSTNSDLALDCLDVRSSTTSITSLATQIVDVLVGTETDKVGGLVAKFAVGDSETTSIEQNIITSLGAGGAYIQILSQRHPGTAVQFVRDNAKVLTTEIVANMMRKIIQSVVTAVGVGQSTYGKDVIDQISKARADMERKLGDLQARYGKISDLTSRFLQFEAALDKMQIGETTPSTK